MSQDNSGSEDPGQGFEQIDADAVCEQCGNVNDEGALLCHVCGNNLRDQRARRVAQGIGPELEESTSKFRLFTGLLVTLGILLTIFLVLNIGNIESRLVSSLTGDLEAGDTNFWNGSETYIYEELLQEMESNPSSTSNRQKALQNHIVETTYNGRYVIIEPGALQASRIVGEANTRVKGDKVYFVVKGTKNDAEIRGFAVLEDVPESGGIRPIVNNTAAIRIRGEEYSGLGIFVPIPSGGHRCWVQSPYDNDKQHELLAYRLR
ncbi:MAG: hypothetical protein COA73_17735 [Candidatus Hydrogenedentota bacterium]|nr:MAG: hypothetical protein COA73_17735 [Candidatus Hydrogenedentota bacterium]